MVPNLLIVRRDEASLEQWVASNGDDCDTTRLSESQFLLPGLVDTHIHAPQYAFTGTATDIPLMEWLEVGGWRHGTVTHTRMCAHACMHAQAGAHHVKLCCRMVRTHTHCTVSPMCLTGVSPAL